MSKVENIENKQTNPFVKRQKREKKYKEDYKDKDKVNAERNK